MNEFITELKNKRKFAVRLGELSDERVEYQLKYESFKKMCSGALTMDQLTDKDMALNIEQKGVDMKIGIDIASLAYKNKSIKLFLYPETAILFLPQNWRAVKG